MSVFSFIYGRWLDTYDSRGIGGRLNCLFFKTLRRLILRFADPPVQMNVRDQMLWMPFSHLLPCYVHGNSQYDTLLSRIADFIRGSNGRITGIDVGANIGDTILACHPRGTDKFLALEPHPVYFGYLQRNLANLTNVQRLQAVCGAKNEAKSGFQVTTNAGTAQVQQTQGSDLSLAMVTLDVLLQNHADFLDCNLLKIDTDGYDFDVISGAEQLIKRAKPIVFFECDTFQNPNFVEDIKRGFGFFAEAGYQKALIYDNLGYLLGCLTPKNLSEFTFLLLHKLTTGKYYFDVLMLPDGDKFLDQELDYFAKLAPDPLAQQASKKVIELIKSN